MSPANFLRTPNSSPFNPPGPITISISGWLGAIYINYISSDKFVCLSKSVGLIKLSKWVNRLKIDNKKIE